MKTRPTKKFWMLTLAAGIVVALVTTSGVIWVRSATADQTQVTARFHDASPLSAGNKVQMFG